MKIYLVQGNTGAWSDREDWIAGAFTTKEKAEERVQFLIDKMLSHGAEKLIEESRHRPNAYLFQSYTWDLYEDGKAYKKMMRYYDPLFNQGYTGTGYRIIETSLDEDIK